MTTDLTTAEVGTKLYNMQGIYVATVYDIHPEDIYPIKYTRTDDGNSSSCKLDGRKRPIDDNPMHMEIDLPIFEL